MPTEKSGKVSAEILAVRDKAINRVRDIVKGVGSTLQPAFMEVVTRAMDQDPNYNLTTEQNGRVVTEYAFGGKLERTIVFDSNGEMRVTLEDERDAEKSGGLKIEATMNSPGFNDEYYVDFKSEGTAGSCLAFSGANNDFLRAMARVGMGFQADFSESRIIRNITDRGLVQGSSIWCKQEDYPNGPDGHRFDREVRQDGGNDQISLYVFENTSNGFRVQDQQLPPSMG